MHERRPRRREMADHVRRVTGLRDDRLEVALAQSHRLGSDDVDRRDQLEAVASTLGHCDVMLTC